ncbi:hypothetical protein COBT_003073 [Conglomerata obtusa]
MTIQIITNDNKIYTLNEHQIRFSFVLENIVKNTILDAPIPLLISSTIFDHILSFMELEQTIHTDNDDYNQIRIKDMHKKMFRNLEIDVIIDIVNAANYLNYIFLMETTSYIVANFFKDKTMEDIRKFMGDDMSEEQRRSVDHEFGWLPDENLEEE